MWHRRGEETNEWKFHFWAELRFNAVKGNSLRSGPVQILYSVGGAYESCNRFQGVTAQSLYVISSIHSSCARNIYGTAAQITWSSALQFIFNL